MCYFHASHRSFTLCPRAIVSTYLVFGSSDWATSMFSSFKCVVKADACLTTYLPR